MTKIRLSIPEPCTENWNEMTATEKGKFCSSCQKEVTDFSKMNTVEIKQYFINQIGRNTCGRFENRQLIEINREEPDTKRMNSKPWWIAAASLFVFANQSYSQGKPNLETKPTTEINKSPIATEAPKNDKVDPGDSVTNDSLVYISGQIIGDEGDTIAFATVRIVEANIGAVTDFEGKFKLVVPKNYQDSLTLQINFVVYKIKTINYKDLHSSKNVGVIRLEKDHELMIFGGITSTIYTEKPTLKVRAKNIFLRMFR